MGLSMFPIDKYVFVIVGPIALISSCFILFTFYKYEKMRSINLFNEIFLAKQKINEKKNK
jgi:hypothetical protein